jgi:hypothetical protein
MTRRPLVLPPPPVLPRLRRFQPPPHRRTREDEMLVRRPLLRECQCWPAATCALCGSSHPNASPSSSKHVPQKLRRGFPTTKKKPPIFAPVPYSTDGGPREKPVPKSTFIIVIVIIITTQNRAPLPGPELRSIVRIVGALMGISARRQYGEHGLGGGCSWQGRKLEGVSAGPRMPSPEGSDGPRNTGSGPDHVAWGDRDLGCGRIQGRFGTTIGGGAPIGGRLLVIP